MIYIMQRDQLNTYVKVNYVLLTELYKEKNEWIPWSIQHISCN